MIIRSKIQLVFAIAMLFSSLNLLAHGEVELPLFVAEDGTNEGDCIDVESPCATIAYALTRAGKGGQIRVTEGTYAIENVEVLYHIISGTVSVNGGFRKQGKAKILQTGATILTGVPFEYRDELLGLGFNVVADLKGTGESKLAATDELLKMRNSLRKSIAATPCQGGVAAGLPCEDVDLLSHVAFSDVSGAPLSTAAVSGADVWGFVDLNTNREYAIVSYSFGTAVFDVTDATNPREVGFVAGQTSTWRDIKVYQFFDTALSRWNAFAYVTTDGSTDGLVVIDMTGLPHSVSRVNYAGDIASAHNVYATNTDYSTGISLTGDTPTLVIAGSDNDNGRYRSYSLANPESPGFITGGTGSGYMHDASSMIISDGRKDTQCVNAVSHCNVLLDFNENSFEIWDVTNSGNPVQLSNTPYVNATYVHSGWWSEDRQYLFVHDELDERNRLLPTTVRVFSVADLTQPTLAGTWNGPTTAIDHNGFTRGNRYYMSNYTRGLTILDITDPATPADIGRLDTYPMSDATGFFGAWGAYPFFYSGNIAISDIDSGFYMAADMTRNVAQGRLEFTLSSYGAVEGQPGQLLVQRVGGSSDNVSVNFEVVHATADSQDYALASGVLNWNSGDTSSRSINLTLMDDGLAEGIERLLVRLTSPGGGATLGNLNTASFYISDPGEFSQVSFAETAIAAEETGFATLVAVVQRTGSAGGPVSIDFAMTAGSAIAGTDFQGTTTGTLNWADGDANPKVLEFQIVDDGIAENDEFFDITLSNPIGATINGPATVNANILDGSLVTQPPVVPPPTSGGGGGGSFDWLALLSLCIFPAFRRTRKLLSACRKT